MALRVLVGLCAVALACALAADAVGGSAGRARRFRPSIDPPRRFTVYSNPIDATGLRRASSTPVSALVGGRGRWSQRLANNVQMAAWYLEGAHNIPATTIHIADAYTDDLSGITHVYAQQVVEGLAVTNGLANVNIDSNGRVISSSESFAPDSQLIGSALSKSIQAARASATDSLRAAVGLLATTLSAGTDERSLANIVVSSAPGDLAGAATHTISGLPAALSPSGSCTAALELIRTSEGQVAPVWHIWLQQPGHWWNAHVNTDLGRVEALSDWAFGADASYRVLPRTVLSPDDGERQLLRGQSSSKASPQGWVTADVTTGNNVWAQSNPSGGDTWETNYRPRAHSGMMFDYPFDKAQEPTKYTDYAVTQLFYTVNLMHDLSYLYGFTEAAGNFQDVNFSGQGAGGDYVVAFAQDGSGMNNAMFLSPPDGQHGVMTMFLWNQTTPMRDGGLEQDIVIHEFTHGISNRLTGGPSNADCLSSGNSAGMGEGWSDTVANIVRIRPKDTRSLNLELGVYANGQGIRAYPYSTSMSTNPLTYGSLNQPGYQDEHQIGEVWASLLYEVMWNLMDAHGISEDLFDVDLRTGNALFLQLLFDGMKLQPCCPTFVDGRDAILQADQVASGGKNKCAIWRGFAKRGLGTNASATRKVHHEDYGLPSDCNH